jgi:hypothetical protein
MQRVMGWIDEHFSAMSRKNKKNTLRSFLMAGIEPSRDFGPPRIDTLPSGQQFYRVRTAEARGWQRPTSMDTHGQAMLLRGGHGTTSNGLLGIMGERRFRRGEYGGIYAQVTINGTDREEVALAMARVAKGTKNWSGVLVEVPVGVDEKRWHLGRDRDCEEGGGRPQRERSTLGSPLSLPVPDGAVVPVWRSFV